VSTKSNEKRTYYLYKCVAKRQDNTELERIIKIQAFFNVEDLAITLHLLSDDQDMVKSLKIKTNDYENELNNHCTLYVNCFTFNDLEDDKNIDIEIEYDDGLIHKYHCEYIGCDITEKIITRTVPLCISCHGFHRFGYDKYFLDNLAKYPNISRSEALLCNFYLKDYLGFENNRLFNAVKNLKVLFNCSKEEYYF